MAIKASKNHRANNLEINRMPQTLVGIHSTPISWSWTNKHQ